MVNKSIIVIGILIILLSVGIILFSEYTSLDKNNKQIDEIDTKLQEKTNISYDMNNKSTDIVEPIIVKVEYNLHNESNKEQQLSKIKNWAIQLQNADPNSIANSGFDLVVIDYSRDGSEEGEYSQEDIQKIKDGGVIPIAYLSIGEAEDYRFYWKEEWNKYHPDWLGKENPDWEGNYAVKYWKEEWNSIIHSYLDKIIEQGFSGIYLDRVDEFEYWSNAENDESLHISEEEATKRMINLIIDIANYSRTKGGSNFYIILQNGEKILKYDNGTLLDTTSGWAAESLFYNRIEPWNNEDTNWILENRLPYLDVVVSKGKPVFSVDYVDNGSGYYSNNEERINDYREKAIKKKYIPYVATSDGELNKLNIITGIQP